MGEPDLFILHQDDEVRLSQYKTQLFNPPARAHLCDWAQSFVRESLLEQQKIQPLGMFLRLRAPYNRLGNGALHPEKHQLCFSLVTSTATFKGVSQVFMQSEVTILTFALCEECARRQC
jgi:hypothetical protein